MFWRSRAICGASASNRSVCQNADGAGGDAVSIAVTCATQFYRITFDYFGTCGHHCGDDFIGDRTGQAWHCGSAPTYATPASAAFLVDDRHQYSTLVASLIVTLLGARGLGGSGRGGGDAWFDTIVVSGP